MQIIVNVTCYTDSQPCPLVVHCSKSFKFINVYFITFCCVIILVDPCAGLNCSVGSQCMVDQPSGTGYCAPSCDLDNGGCTADQQCVLEQVQCIASPCPPIVQCVQGRYCSKHHLLNSLLSMHSV